VNAATDWWRSFFSGVVLDMWSRAVPEDQTRAEADFLRQALSVAPPAHLLRQALSVAPPAHLLDVPCGNGRVALELAAQGYRMTGADLAEGFLAEARARSAGRGLPVSWMRADMRDLPQSADYDGAFCWGNSFGYLDDEGNVAFLRAVAGALRPGARFVLDALVLELFASDCQERRWYELGDILFLIANRYDPARGRLETEYTFVRDGKVDRRLGSQRAYSYSELCRLLREAGFSEPEGYGSLAREPFKLGSPRLLLVATRAG
jgi:SAM-dependent methyltransferase